MPLKSPQSPFISMSGYDELHDMTSVISFFMTTHSFKYDKLQAVN